MHSKISGRLLDIVNALPLKKGMRVLEIGCGPGAMAREMARRVGKGHVLAIDRSEKAIAQAIAGSAKEMDSGILSFRKTSIEDFQLEKDEAPFDLAVAIRVGVLDGRHPEKEQQAMIALAKALRKEGKIFIDGGDPLIEISI